jgi:hypothetical protein
MKARSLIDGASFGPDALKALGQAFDEGWTQIADNFGSEPAVVESARLNLRKPSCRLRTTIAEMWKP